MYLIEALWGFESTLATGMIQVSEIFLDKVYVVCFSRSHKYSLSLFV